MQVRPGLPVVERRGPGFVMTALRGALRRMAELLYAMPLIPGAIDMQRADAIDATKPPRMAVRKTGAYAKPPPDSNEIRRVNARYGGI